MYRNTYLKINVDRYIENIRYVKEKTGKKIIAIIKANAYGLIDYYITSFLRQEGIDFFGVSSLDEALALRERGILEKILVLGYVDKKDLVLCKENDISVVTISKEYVKEALEELKDVNVHIKVDTGMNRLGIETDEVKEVFDLLKGAGSKIEGIMTHFAKADCDKEFTLRQYNDFKNSVEACDYDFKYIHCSATDASLTIKEDFSNYIRLGLGMLGYSDVDDGLKECLSLISEVSLCKKVANGEGIGYGQKYVSDGEGYILTVPIGYADGFLRNNTGKKVYVDGEYGEIVGNVCMDQLMVKTLNYHKEGTAVELYGDHVSLKKRANDLNTISYELITLINDRVTRKYEYCSKIVDTINERLKLK